MTSKITGDPSRKVVAAGRKREAAIRVLLPRILGALEHDGQALHRPKSYPMLVAARASLRIHLIPSSRSVFLRVIWQERLVLCRAIRLDALGEYYAGRVSVAAWERGGDSRAWQTELLDTFTTDSERLLTIPMSELPAAVAGLVRLPAVEVEQIVWGGPATRTREIAAQHLWRDLGDACARAGQGQLTTEELGQVALELGLGLLASGSDKNYLLALLGQVREEIEHNRLSIVNAGLMRDFWNPHLQARSWIRSLSGLDHASPFWATGQMLMVGKLRPSTSAKKGR